MWTSPPLVIVQEVQFCLFQRVPSSNAIQLVCAHGSVVHAHAARGACVRSGLLQWYTVSLKRLPPAWDAYTHWRLLSCLGTIREQEGNTHFCFSGAPGKMWPYICKCEMSTSATPAALPVPESDLHSGRTKRRQKEPQLFPLSFSQSCDLQSLRKISCFVDFLVTRSMLAQGQFSLALQGNSKLVLF